MFPPFAVIVFVCEVPLTEILFPLLDAAPFPFLVPELTFPVFTFTLQFLETFTEVDPGAVTFILFPTFTVVAFKTPAIVSDNIDNVIIFFIKDFLNLFSLHYITVILKKYENNHIFITYSKMWNNKKILFTKKRFIKNKFFFRVSIFNIYSIRKNTPWVGMAKVYIVNYWNVGIIYNFT